MPMTSRNTKHPIDIERVRARFPSLVASESREPLVHFDGPAGSQTPSVVIEAVVDTLARVNANRGGFFETSRAVGRIFDEAGAAVADLLGTVDPKTVIFGPNMTSLTLTLSRALGREWSAADEIVVTRAEHDANFTPWALAARDAGAIVREVGIEPDGTVDLEALASVITERTRLVAIGCASNLIGTVQPFEEAIRIAKRAGALVFLDAVHYAPHRRMRVEAWGADFLACSAYKFFGPHVGILWGRRELLERITPYKVRPASEAIPDRWMNGTQSHEGIAGTLAAIEYIADLGRESTVDGEAGGSTSRDTTSRRDALDLAFEAISSYETLLARRLLEGLAAIPGVRIHGVANADEPERRVSTVAFTHARRSPADVARELAARGICVWSGNSYALPLSEALGLEPHGAIRVGILHYNTEEEVDRLLRAVESL